MLQMQRGACKGTGREAAAKGARGVACGEREGGKDQPGAALDGTITLH